MALTKNELLSLIAINFPDNDTASITPALLRQVNEQIVTSSENTNDALSQVFSGGFFDYADTTTTVTPLAIIGGAAAQLLTNDGAGGSTNKLYPPPGVTDVWNGTTNTFNFSELKLGDMVDIRLDFNLISVSTNTEISVDLHLGTGAGAYSIPWILDSNFKTAGTHKLNRYNGIYMGDTNTLNNGGSFKITADKDCSIVVNGWYCKIIKRG